jgi:hypothetical protein
MATPSALTNGVVLTLLVVAAAISWAPHPRIAAVSMLLAIGHLAHMAIKRLRAH